MIMQPKVSIIVPCWNVEKYINCCINSLVNQTLRDIEIILVDDESPDRVPQICDDWVAKSIVGEKLNDKLIPPIHVIHKKNGGLGFACNSGLEKAQGKYVAFCDSDDWVENNMYEEMFNVAEKYNADAVYSGIQYIDDNRVVTPLAGSKSFKIIDGRNNVHSFLMDMVALPPTSKIDRNIQMSAKIVLYKKSIIDNNNLKFESERNYICEDLIWNIDFLVHAEKVCVIPKTYYYYYRNLNSLTQKIRNDRMSFFVTLREEVVRRSIIEGVPAEIKNRADRMTIGHIRQYLLQICRSEESWSVKRSLMKEICNDKILQDIKKEYPISKLPFKYRIVMFFIYHKMYEGLYMLFNIKK